MNYSELKEMAARAKDPAKGKLVGHCTRAFLREDGTIAVRYHETDVVVARKNNTFTLNSGGWHTKTTKEKINEFSPARMYANKGVWYIGEAVFQDGITVDARGKAIKRNKASEKKMLLARKLVGEYVNGFAESIRTKGIEFPSGGDCWYCWFWARGERTVESESFDHVVQHIRDRYYVPSLLFRALVGDWFYGTKRVVAVSRAKKTYAYIREYASGNGSVVAKRALRSYLNKRIGKIADGL